MKKRYLFQHLGLALLVPATALTLAGCESKESLRDWIERTNELRETAVQASSNVPYRQEQYEALKSYFIELNQKLLMLKEKPSNLKRFNREIAKVDLEDACAKVLVTRSQWLGMVENCTKNGFFLCAEEVRAYPEMVNALREMLTESQRKRFDETNSCSAAI